MVTLVEGTIINERYKLKRQLGHGNFGNVWLAYSILADIDVAIKFYGAFDEKGIEEFRKEFQVAYKLRHPNLLNINHLDVFENCPYLVMPYCANGSVAARLGKFSEIEIWDFILDVSCGISFLHSQQPHIVHQDIKPDNILITDKNRYVIADFGISRSFRTQLSRTKNNIDSSGTLAYMGPERFSDQPMIVLASDIWAFGMTLYEVITGEILWEGLGGCVQLNGARIPAINNVSTELAQLITACLSAETWNRPTAAQIYEYAQAYTQKKPLPPLKHATTSQIVEIEDSNAMRESVISSENLGTNNSYNKVLSQNSTLYHQRSKSLWQNRVWLKRTAIAIFACLGVLLTGFLFMIYRNYISEEQDFLSCKTKQDFEQFIEKYPSSRYVIAAQKRITSTTPQKTERLEKKEEQQVEEGRFVTNTPFIKQQEKKKKYGDDIIEFMPNDISGKAVAEDDHFFYNCQSVNDFMQYLSKFPKGKHRAEALRAMQNNQTFGVYNNDESMPPQRHSLIRQHQRVESPTSTSIKIGINTDKVFDRKELNKPNKDHHAPHQGTSRMRR